MSADTNSSMMGLLVAKITVTFIVILAIVFFVFSNSGNDQEISTAKSILLAEATAERLTPVGQVQTKVDEATVGTKPAAQAEETVKSAESIVNSVCSSCHGTGLLGAPKVQNDSDWAERNKKGLEALVASSIKGIGNMPPRGGSSISDEEMSMAVKYMSGL